MSPCKYCIVRACCTQGCKLYKRFASNTSTTLSFLSMLFAVIFIVIPMVYLIEVYPNKEHAQEIIQWTWTICLIFNIAFGKLCLGVKARVFEIFFGPICTFIYLFLFITSKIIKVTLLKRV